MLHKSSPKILRQWALDQIQLTRGSKLDANRGANLAPIDSMRDRLPSMPWRFWSFDIAVRRSRTGARLSNQVVHFGLASEALQARSRLVRLTMSPMPKNRYRNCFLPDNAPLGGKQY